MNEITIIFTLAVLNGLLVAVFTLILSWLMIGGDKNGD